MGNKGSGSKPLKSLTQFCLQMAQGRGTGHDAGRQRHREKPGGSAEGIAAALGVKRPAEASPSRKR